MGWTACATPHSYPLNGYMLSTEYLRNAPSSSRELQLLHHRDILPSSCTVIQQFCLYPCPCGYHGDTESACTCPPASIARYAKRVSVRLLDRINIRVEVPRVNYEHR
jgi:hypothetical protein